MSSVIRNKKIYNTDTAKLIEKINTNGSYFETLYEKNTGELFVEHRDGTFFLGIEVGDSMLNSLGIFDANKISEKSKKYHEISE